MNKLEVGNYVRTEEGQIYKIEEVLGNRYYVGLSNNVIDVYGQRVITKASHNIIDLVEEGDYVNGFLVMSNDYNFDKPIKIFHNLRFGEKDIKSIVTKEQFKSVEYEV